jgi:hypothetical protein
MRQPYSCIAAALLIRNCRFNRIFFNPIPAGLLTAGVFDEALFFEFQQATLDGAQRKLRLSDDIRRVAV